MGRAARPTNLPAVGAVGTPPPPDAPYEIAQPLTPALEAEQLARARANEVELPPFAPSGKPPLTEEQQRLAGILPMARPAAGAGAGASGRPSLDTTPVEAIGAVAGAVAGAGELGSATLSAPLAPVATPAPEMPPLPPILPHQKAASNTDGPSRGVPRGTSRAGLEITGGFGSTTEAQYFPLDGAELRELVRALLDRLNDQLETDLRFSMALTYPRVAARLILEVQAFNGGDGSGFVLEKRMAPHEKTPLAVARAYADEVCFVLIEERREMTPDGASIAPPDAIRVELGLPRLVKQQVKTAAGVNVADVPVVVEA